MASIAHIGYGYWGKNIARNFAELGLLAAIVDPNPASAEAGAKAHGVRAASFDEVLADPAIDGVSIAAPAELHFKLASAALQAGKHVFVEKPLTIDIGEAEALCAIADKAGLTLMVGHLLQYHPVYVKLREMVAAGELGKLQYVYSNRQSLGKFRREENVLWSFAPHDISMILGLTGEEPHHVSAQGCVAYTPGVADMVTMQMHFPSGVAGHVQTCWMHPFKEQKLVVIGEKASAVFEDSLGEWEQKLLLYPHKIDTSGAVPVPTKADAVPIAVAKSEPLKAECQHFADCIDGRTTARSDGAEGTRVLRVLDRAEKALTENLKLQTA
ncbi:MULTISPECIES: Gfo/Idh/MocA family protein [Mesorhizobium]|uniref:Gfo/Idh/MocA family oxidoreductase n=1 Tax=Mesorhizobium denitrificans TaxID=2294114 RepID=A0A371XC09_9HYPH|nr:MULTISPECIES: Gfo/Idh/MocA family oxidoreductase [Mesorhizobium]RFC66759.1 gfo/Idh/MocA family oxidoreductase [Mesorhizobium denitrificans]